MLTVSFFFFFFTAPQRLLHPFKCRMIFVLHLYLISAGAFLRNLIDNNDVAAAAERAASAQQTTNTPSPIPSKASYLDISSFFGLHKRDFSLQRGAAKRIFRVNQSVIYIKMMGKKSGLTLSWYLIS